MTRPSRLLRLLRRLVPAAAVLLALAAAGAAIPDLPSLGSIDEDCTAFTFGRDGRMAFAVHHVFNQHKFMIQRDDFWVGEPGKGKRKILNGEKLVRGEGGFSYTVHSLRWSPDGTKLTAELLTSTEEEHHSDVSSATMSFLLDANGLEIHIAGGGDSMIPESTNAAWLDDESTVVYLADETRPRSQFSINTVRPADGKPPERLFPDTLFLGAAWQDQGRQALAVTADSGPRGKPQLVLLDLDKQKEKPLATLDGFAGGLKLSPSGQKVAYFRDMETLEVRSLANPEKVLQHVQALTGVFFWTQDEEHILLKAGPDRRSGIIEVIRLRDGGTDDMFHGLTFWNFAVSPDGRRIGVTPPGKHVVNVFSLEGLR
ncbi:MAG TPA: hypothetical protein VKG84_05990 [Candidatus Acidoferrales bacterium]|nr:hypothetical protein [Candidatus Acidoferrales bacterium]